MIVKKNVIQGSDEWFDLKLGKPSASNASKIITNSGKQSKQREGYLYTLAAEIITGQHVNNFISDAMQEGKNREQDSRTLYEVITGSKVEQVGLIWQDEKKEILCSPDGIIEENYGLELKNVLPKTQVKYLLQNRLPVEYFSQVQFSLFVTGFQRWDFFSYSPGLKPLFIKVTRDEDFIKSLEIEINLFLAELKNIVKKVK